MPIRRTRGENLGTSAVARNKRKRMRSACYESESLERRILFSNLLVVTGTTGGGGDVIVDPSGSTESMFVLAHELGPTNVVPLTGNVSLAWWNGTPLSTSSTAALGSTVIATEPQQNLLDSANDETTHFTFTIDQATAA